MNAATARKSLRLAEDQLAQAKAAGSPQDVIDAIAGRIDEIRNAIAESEKSHSAGM